MLPDNKQVVLAYVDAFNRGDLNALVRQFTDDAEIHGVLGWGGLAGAKPIWKDLIECFAVNLHVEAMAAESHIVAVRFIERGRSVKSFRGGPVTGRSYEVIAIEWFEIANGLIRRRWGARDSAAIFKQMGLPLGERCAGQRVDCD